MLFNDEMGSSVNIVDSNEVLIRCGMFRCVWCNCRPAQRTEHSGIVFFFHTICSSCGGEDIRFFFLPRAEDSLNL
jgi:hypothetical protein